ncbi:MAG: uridine kinase [Clostridiales bacterium]|nr:uridine kinase [Clostridiales bacterium]
MILIGICGPSGSGKTTLAEELVKAVGASSAVLKQDAYYLDYPELSLAERRKINFDEPGVFDHGLLLKDVQTLLSGRPVTRKAYDFERYARDDKAEWVQPADVLVLEGIHAFYDDRICDLMFLKLYINVEPDICLLRRINRDYAERGRSIGSITDQYLQTVKPMYDKYIRNYITKADVIVTRGGKDARIVEILAGYLRDALER